MPALRLRRRTVIALALAASWAVSSLATAGGETWRRPTDTAFEGPSAFAFDPAQVEASVARVGKKSRRRWPGPMPALEIVATNPDGSPAAGVAVRVAARVGNKRREKTWLVAEGVTGADGRAHLEGTDLPGVKYFHAWLTWHGGYQSIHPRIGWLGRGLWALGASPYYDAAADKELGSCLDLVELEGGDVAGSTLRLHFDRPRTLLACEGVAYGADRKSATFAQLDEIGRRDINRGDKNMFGADAETQMGLEVGKEVRKQFPFHDDPVLKGYLQDMLDRLVAASDSPDMPVEVNLIHEESVNAFATAGGNVYVFTGLIDAAETEAQLAGVLAHELTHVLGRHVTEGMTRSMKTQFGTVLAAIGLGAAADLDSNDTETLLRGSLVTAGLVGMKYTRAAEAEADLLGMQYLWNAGWDPEGLPQFFQVLEERHPNSAPGWLSDHPTHEKRTRYGIQWARGFLPERERYLVSTRRFEQMQERVRALPPPPKRRTQDGQATVASFRNGGSFQRLLNAEMDDVLSQLLGPPPPRR